MRATDRIANRLIRHAEVAGLEVEAREDSHTTESVYLTISGVRVRVSGHGPAADDHDLEVGVTATAADLDATVEAIAAHVADPRGSEIACERRERRAREIALRDGERTVANVTLRIIRGSTSASIQVSHRGQVVASRRLGAGEDPVAVLAHAAAVMCETNAVISLRGQGRESLKALATSALRPAEEA